MITVHPIAAPLGARVTGLDLMKPLSSEALGGILDALYRHGVVVIPGQAPTPAGFDRFARCLGRPQPHVLTQLRHREQPSILVLSNIVENGEPVGLYDGAAYWHTDMSYDAEPAMATLVHCIRSPASGGETLFADMFTAYDSLVPELKQRIDNLVVLHHYGNRDDLDESSRTSAARLTDEQKRQVHDVFHRLVRPHPATGRKALYAVCGSAFGIVGMADDESLALLRELAAHATRADHVYRHRYASGDVVIWDNNSTLHSATPIEPARRPEEERLLYRISVKADPALTAFRA